MRSGLALGQPMLDQAGLFGANGNQHLIHFEGGERLDADEVADMTVVLAGVDAIGTQQLREWPQVRTALLASHKAA